MLAKLFLKKATQFLSWPICCTSRPSNKKPQRAQRKRTCGFKNMFLTCKNKNSVVATRIVPSQMKVWQSPVALTDPININYNIISPEIPLAHFQHDISDLKDILARPEEQSGSFSSILNFFSSRENGQEEVVESEIMKMHGNLLFKWDQDKSKIDFEKFIQKRPIEASYECDLLSISEESLCSSDYKTPSEYECQYEEQQSQNSNFRYLSNLDVEDQVTIANIKEDTFKINDNIIERNDSNSVRSSLSVSVSDMSENDEDFMLESNFSIFNKTPTFDNNQFFTNELFDSVQSEFMKHNDDPSRIEEPVHRYEELCSARDLATGRSCATKEERFLSCIDHLDDKKKSKKTVKKVANLFKRAPNKSISTNISFNANNQKQSNSKEGMWVTSPSQPKANRYVRRHTVVKTILHMHYKNLKKATKTKCC